MKAELSHDVAFAEFVTAREAGLRRALVSEFGLELGRDAASQALLYGLENWERVSRLDNPAGYLFRVGQRWGRRHRPKRFHFGAIDPAPNPWFEPGLPAALMALPARQRVSVILRHGSDMAYGDIAHLTNQSEATVRKQVERGLAALRRSLEVDGG